MPFPATSRPAQSALAFTAMAPTTAVPEPMAAILRPAADRPMLKDQLRTTQLTLCRRLRGNTELAPTYRAISGLELALAA